MKIALVQQKNTKDREANLARGLRALEEAAAAGAGLVAYPELSFLWFLPQHPADSRQLALAQTVPGPITDAFRRKAQELGVVVLINLLERDGNKTYDTTVVIDRDGRLAGKNRMIHITDLPGFLEKGYYAPGDLGAGVFDTAAGRIGIAICYDRHFPEYMRALALKGADLVVVPQAGALGEWPEGLYEAELRVAAFQNGYFAALANRVGKEDRLTFAGESYVAGPDGAILARAPRGEDHILYADIDYTLLEKSPARRFFLRDRRPEIYSDL
ncbi:MAG: carbon-nitrogen hydrolase family protein [Candidatus Krumholzibacteriota bacterium]|nr:carbon-nitrogen hydrolase family protein [Candidatus Krumholzibacteriota bacterium]